MKDSLEKVKDYVPHVRTYVLSSGIHPNKYGFTPDEVLKKLKIHEDGFVRLFENLTR